METTSEVLTIGEAVKAYREGRGISKRALSLQAGLSESYVNKLERGEIEPSFAAMAKLVHVLGMNKGEIWVLVKQEANR